ncbi:MAG: DUF551 domain-containing protein [Erysipelotrichaceae bacterium]
MAEWISISEKEPEESGYYLVYDSRKYNSHNVCLLWFFKKDDGYSYWEGENIYTITHWMPLPAAPENCI